MSYTTTKKVWEELQKFTEVNAENIGTGDGLKKEFSVANKYIIDSTYVVYLDGVIQNEVSDYLINLVTGTITFVNAPAVGVVVTIDYWYADILDYVVADWIEEVEEQMDNELNTSFEPKTITDAYYDYAKERGNYQFKLWKRPIISVISFSLNEAKSNDDVSWKIMTEGYGNDYLINLEDGIIYILNKDLGYDDLQNVKISFEYGYSSVPVLAERLATLLTAKIIIGSKIMGEDFSSQDSIRIAEISISKASTEVAETIEGIQTDIDRLFKMLRKGYEVDII